MRKFLLAIALALMVPAVAHAQGANPAGIQVPQLGGSARYTEQLIPQFTTALTSSSGSSLVVGRSGLIVNNSVAGQFSMNLTATTSPALGPMPYPVKVTYRLFDVDLSGTLQCTRTSTARNGGITISGSGVDGGSLTFYDSTLTETAETTSYVFPKINKVHIEGCVNGNATDTLFVTTSNRLGFRGGVKSSADFIAVCLERLRIDAEPRCALVTSCTTRSLAGNKNEDFLDPTSCTWPGTGIALTDDDAVLMRYWVSAL